MKKILCIVCFVFCTAVSFAADDRFVDCGPGYVIASRKSTHGIRTEECKKVWCVDLENGKPMGSGSTAHKGYKDTPNELWDNKNNHIKCFGDRIWCDSDNDVRWDEDVGAYVKIRGDHKLRGVLSGSGNTACYKWQDVGDHGCSKDKGEVAIMSTDANGNIRFVCAKETAVGSARSAIKSRALRRTAGPAPAIRKR